ncbi:MAG: DUF1987 domain-containing protein [Bacteroidales bacterium]|jgi:hypothetical protein|nr:DUF1987 domain-containing protein [Bacteroidales bacterium]
MQKLYQAPTELDPEIILSHEEKIFRISGTSSPENVRATYEPAIEWMRNYRNMLKTDRPVFTDDDPLVLELDLEYFNSSSAIFLYELVMIIKAIEKDGVPAIIRWSFDPADTDSREAGEDLAILAEMEFEYTNKKG